MILPHHPPRVDHSRDPPRCPLRLRFQIDKVPLVSHVVPEVALGEGNLDLPGEVQWNLARKKTPTPLGPPYDPRRRRTVES